METPMQLLEQLGTDNVVHDKRKVLLCLKNIMTAKGPREQLPHLVPNLRANLFLTLFT